MSNHDIRFRGFPDDVWREGKINLRIARRLGYKKNKNKKNKATSVLIQTCLLRGADKSSGVGLCINAELK